MDSVKCKELVVESIRRHFEGALQQAKQLGGGSSEALKAIEKIMSSLLRASGGVEARIYDDYNLSSKLLEQGVDLAYRSVVVSDLERDDEWVAVLAIGLTELDEHSRNVVLSQMPKHDGGGATPRRLLVFVTCAARRVSLQPRFAIASEVEKKSIALSPCVFQWAIPLRNGQSAVVGHIPHIELGQEFLDWAGQMISVLDSAHTAKWLDDHGRGKSRGTMQ